MRVGPRALEAGHAWPIQAQLSCRCPLSRAWHACDGHL